MVEPEYEVFISHRYEDRRIANLLKNYLRPLSKYQLEVHVCEDMQGGVEWRKCIEDQIAGSKVLIFLYTDDEANWSWCQYEVGLFRGESKDGHIVCLKNTDIPKAPSTIEHLQAYSADKEGIKMLFNDLLCRKDFFGEELNPELHMDGTMQQSFDEAVDKLIKCFTPPVRTEYLLQRMAITLSREISEGEILVLDLDDMGVSGNEKTMSLLGLRETDVRWNDLYGSFHEKGQTAWLDQLLDSIDKIKRHLQPTVVMQPFRALGGDTFIPVMSCIESFRLRDEQGVRPKQLFVTFVPIGEGLEKPYALQDMRELFRKWSTYLPSSVVRIKWRRRSGEMEYIEDDLEEGPIVCAINPEFARLFDFDAAQFPDPDGPRKLTAQKLFDSIKKYTAPEHLVKLEEDQAKVAKRIVFENKKRRAKAPLQFNDRHPNYPNGVYLPSLICKHVIGDVSGPHETYLLICYVKLFRQTDDPKNP